MGWGVSAGCIGSSGCLRGGCCVTGGSGLRWVPLIASAACLPASMDACPLLARKPPSPWLRRHGGGLGDGALAALRPVGVVRLDVLFLPQVYFGLAEFLPFEPGGAASLAVFMELFTEELPEGLRDVVPVLEPDDHGCCHDDCPCSSLSPAQ